MTRIAKSTARLSMTVAFALLAAGLAAAQAKPAVSTAVVSTKQTAAAPKPAATGTKPAPAVKPAKPPVKAPATAMATSPASKPASPKLAAQKSAVAKPATPAKPGASKPAMPKPAKPAVAQEKPADASATAPTPDQPPANETLVAHRDPFVSMVDTRTGGGGPTLPPGKAGLVVATVRVDGAVKSGSDLIAVVSNPEQHVYFIRAGDQLYDGTVEKIDLDGVTFHENSKDAFGKPVVREVTKRIYASAGEQQ